jgi:acetyl esterase/lipase
MWAINHQKRISKGDQVKESSMKIDPEFEVVLSGLPEFVFNSDTLALSRELMPVAEPPSKDIERTEFTIADGAVVVSVHRPREVPGLLPAVLWIHGGGMIIGNRHMDNAQLERWCRSFSCTCVSVEYRLAPEYPFPAPLEDCYAALLWMVKEAGQLQIDISRIGVGGKSAGCGRLPDGERAKRPTAQLPNPRLPDVGRPAEHTVESARRRSDLEPGIKSIRLEMLFG